MSGIGPGISVPCCNVLVKPSLKWTHLLQSQNLVKGDKVETQKR